MKVGDKVMWTSQSQGYVKKKFGEIMAIIPPRIPPMQCIPFGYRCNSKAGYGGTRDHESYLVKVDGMGNALYWPIVKKLILRGD